MTETAEKSDLILKLYGRIDFLLNLLPDLEGLIQEFSSEIEGRKHLSKAVSAKELFEVYEKMFNSYNSSLELIRKILIYFPVKMSKDQKDLLLLYSSLDEDNKLNLINYVQGIARLSEESRQILKDVEED